VRHFAINAANFSISTLVLQKQHSFKHNNVLKCANIKFISKPFYAQILSYDTYFNIAERNLSYLKHIDTCVDIATRCMSSIACCLTFNMDCFFCRGHCTVLT